MSGCQLTRIMPKQSPSGSGRCTRQDALRDRANLGTNVRPLERERQRSLDQSELATAIKPTPFKRQCVERLLPDQFGHRIGQLDFTAGAPLLQSATVTRLPPARAYASTICRNTAGLAEHQFVR
jgi:hypothetical protein